MDDKKFIKNLLMLGAGIDVCLKKKLIVPALILIYSAIDTVAWLSSGDKYATNSSFISWVDSYLLKAKPLPCSAVDLYAARCGLLHTSSPDSRLSDEGKARRVCYSWGSADVKKLRKTIGIIDLNDRLVAVHISDLFEAWRLGLALFVEELEKDDIKRQRVYGKVEKLFGDISKDSMDALIASAEINGIGMRSMPHK